MKKKLLAVASLILATCLLLTISSNAETVGKSTNEGNNAVASITADGNTLYYDRLDDALNEVQNNQTIVMLKDLGVPTDSGNNGFVEKKGTKVTGVVLDLNNHTIASSDANKNTVEIEDDSSITIKNGTIKHTENRIALKVGKGEVTLENVTVENKTANGGRGAIQVGNNANSTSGSLVINEGTKINGVIVVATSSKLEMNGGEIDGGNGFAIAGNGSKSESTEITINGGTLKSDGTAVIYHPQSGTLNVKGGTLTGKFGIVARRGDINVTGGTITATGTGTDTVGDAVDKDGKKVELPVGTAFVIDNSAENYDGDAKVTIGGGTVSANELILYSLDDEEEHKDFLVTGGKFDKAVDVAYVSTDKAEVKIGDKYYIGDDATEAITEAIKDEKAVIEVLKGNVTIKGAVPGVTVQNLGNGNVTVNGMKVTADDEVVVPEPEEEEQDDTPKMGTVNVFAVAGAILVVSALGVVVLNKRK